LVDREESSWCTVPGHPQILSAAQNFNLFGNFSGKVVLLHVSFQKRVFRVQSFSELSLSPALSRAISELGYEKPSPVQAETLPILLGEPTDFIGLAATGTGKTAAFAIPLLERINPAVKTVQALILCPTRELALQVSGQVDLLGKYKKIQSVPIYGGAGYHEQFVGLHRGTSVVVGTPGRVIDHIKKGSLVLSQVSTLILDEADEMISMGFKDELEEILAAVPTETCKTWLFSATMSREVRRVADKYLRDPKQVQVNRTEMLPETIEQIYYLTHEGNKPEVLCKLIDAAEDFYGIVFCQTKSLVTDLTQYLLDRGYKTDCLHGDKNQTAREKTMQLFRDRKVTVMVCTDVAARGLDVKDVTHVINYSIPRELDNYVHRIGRTGRSGKAGFALSLVTPSHRRLIFQIEQMTKRKMKEGRIPTRREIGTRKVAKLLPQFMEEAQFSRAIEILDDSWKEALAAMSPEEIAGRFLAMRYPEVFHGVDIPQLSLTPPPRRREQQDGARADGPRARTTDRRDRPEPRFSHPRADRPQYGDRPVRSERPVRAERPEPRPQFSRPQRDEGFERRGDDGFERRAPVDRSNRPGRGAPIVDVPSNLNRRQRRDMARQAGLLPVITDQPVERASARRAGMGGGERPPSRSARSSF
jgi:ATP-dependent RNA helicase DeaD